jgi:hypothetical protein
MSRVIALLLCATAATAAVAAPGERQAVLLPLVSVAINETERTALEEGLRGRTSRFGVVPLGRDETIAILQDVASLGLSCDYGALECLVRVGAARRRHRPVSSRRRAVRGDDRRRHCRAA